MISFQLEQLLRFKEILPNFPLGYLSRHPDLASVEICDADGFQGLFSYITTVTRDVVDAARARKILVGVRGALAPEDLLSVRDLGVLGVIVDWPTAARDLFALTASEYRKGHRP